MVSGDAVATAAGERSGRHGAATAGVEPRLVSFPGSDGIPCSLPDPFTDAHHRSALRMLGYPYYGMS